MPSSSGCACEARSRPATSATATGATRRAPERRRRRAGVPSANGGAWSIEPGGRAPRRRDESPLAVAGALHVRSVQLHTVPELARDLLVALVEPLAIVGELAAPDEVTEAEPDLPEPVGVAERLPGRGDGVGLAAREDGLGLLEAVDPAARDDGRGVPGLVDGRADRGRQRDVATEGPTLAAQIRRAVHEAGHATPVVT